HTGLQPGDSQQAGMISSLEPTRVAGFLAHGDPQLDSCRELESCRHDADDRVLFIAKRYGLADDRAVSAKSALPQRVRENRNLLSARFVFIRGEHAAKLGLDSQEWKHLGRYHPAFQPLRFCLTGKVEALSPVDGDPFEYLILGAPVLEIRVGDRHSLEHLAAFAQEHQPVRLLVREGPKEHGVDHAEYS